MTQRIAPNNTLPATHFIEVWKEKGKYVHLKLTPNNCIQIESLKKVLFFTESKQNLHTIAIFHIRENKLPTLHKF